MGSYIFKWDRPANEVYVTGTFDDWAKSVKLEKKGDGFEKKVDLPASGQKIYYKFVVDGNWTTNGNAAQETDESNNINNVLKPEDLFDKPSNMSQGIEGATISGVAPDSTTAQLASKVPKESDTAKDRPPSDVPGGFPPETPYHDAQEFSVKPLPATAGAGNPISLKPGEKVPDSSELRTTNDTTTADTLDRESYERSGDNASALHGASTDRSTDNPTIQSSGAGSTTAALAGAVPKEPRKEPEVIPTSETQTAPDVPDVVQESIAKDKTGPEAAANEEAVQEKAAVERELLKEVEPTDARGEPAPVASATTADKAPTATDEDAGMTTANAPATTPAQNAATETAQGTPPDSRDISPLSRPKGQPEPTVTTGAASASAPSKSEPSPASPVSKAGAAASTDKKAKRGSFFGKLKDRFKHKDEK